MTADSGPTDSAEIASRSGAVLFSAVMFVIGVAVVLVAFIAVAHKIGLLAMALSLVVGALMTGTFHIAEQWERAVILRLGRLSRIAGPGPFITLPIVESITMRVDTRMRTTTFGAEQTLSSDLVPIDVDAGLFWMVWDAKLACTEVEDFERAVLVSAQTALRDAIGRRSASEVAIQRSLLDRELQEALSEKTAAWGISVLSVEVRDILMSEELQRAMSLEAQAEQRKKARIALMEAEGDIAEMLRETGEDYEGNDAALRLRAMHLLYECVKETGGTIVVPSSFSEGFGDVLPDDVSDLLKKLGS